MVCDKNWQEISVFENFFDFYTNQFYLKMLKTDSILSGASTKREISSLPKTSFFKGNRRKSNLLINVKPYMTPLLRLKPIRFENWNGNFLSLL